MYNIFMKNWPYIIVIAVCLGLIYFGLAKKPDAQIAKQMELGNQSGTAVGQASKTATTVPVAIGQVAQHFRPDASTDASSDQSKSSAADTAERNFQLTPVLIAKMYLIDKYKFGICYGAPVAVPQSAIDILVSSNPPLVSFLTQKYNLQTDLEKYNKMKQLQAVTLVETASSKFNFTFLDGQCQNTIYYQGTVQVSGEAVSESGTTQESHTYK